MRLCRRTEAAAKSKAKGAQTRALFLSQFQPRAHRGSVHCRWSSAHAVGGGGRPAPLFCVWTSRCRPRVVWKRRPAPPWKVSGLYMQGFVSALPTSFRWSARLPSGRVVLMTGFVQVLKSASVILSSFSRLLWLLGSLAFP